MLRVITTAPVYYGKKNITGTQTYLNANGEIDSNAIGAPVGVNNPKSAAGSAVKKAGKDASKKRAMDNTKGAVKKVGSAAGKVGNFLNNVTTLFSKEPAASASPATAEPEAKKKSNLPVILAIAGVFIVGTIIFVAATKKPATAKA